MTPRTKKCSVCGVEKPLTEFHRRRHYVRAGRRAACKDCTREATRASRQARPAKPDPLKQRVRARTRDAIRRKELVPQPCRDCQSVEVVPHHPDYAAADAHLRVVWLCDKHHALEHGKRAWTNQRELFPGL